MDGLLSRMLSFPPYPPPQHPLSDQQYDEGIKAQIDTMKKMNDKSLMQSTSGGESPLDVINPTSNTVPYIYILLAHASSVLKSDNAPDHEELWTKLISFLCSFDGRQIRYLGSELIRVMEATIKIALLSGQPGAAIGPCAQAILRVDPSGSVLTTAHVYLLKLALETREYEAVTDILDRPILYLPAKVPVSYTKYNCELGLSPSSYVTTSSGLTSKLKPMDVLEYFLYSGMVYIGLQKWKAAFEALENAVTYPSRESGVSLIMVEAYKKWLLVGLLLEGKAPQLPQTTSSMAAKSYHVIATPYEAVASIFETGTASRLKSEIEHGHKVWEEDANTGLMLCVLAAYQKSHIRNLAKVYSNIGVSEVNSLTTSAETGTRLSSTQRAEELIESMIGEGTLHATMIRDQAGHTVLSFSPSDGPVLSEVKVQRELVTTTQQIQTLAAQIKATNRILTHDKRYLESTMKAKKSVKIGGPGDINMDYNVSMEDEDIMTEM